MSTKAAIYARQSLDVSEGIERQLTRMRADAARRGWDVVREYTDNEVSASKVRGPGTQWARMLADADRGVFTHVVAVDLDRLVRSTRDLIALTERNLRVVTLDGEIDLSTADGEFRATMLASVARFEVRRKSERQLRANEQRIQKGKPIPGRRRYGYESDNMTPREPEAEDVRKLYRDFLAGVSIRQLSLARNWRPVRTRDTLANPCYAGNVVHRGVVSPSDLVVALVNAEDWQKAQAILTDPTRRTTPGPSVKHLASNIALCAECGHRLIFMRGYLCRHDTSHVWIKKEKLDARIRAAVVEAFVTGRVRSENVDGSVSDVSVRLEAARERKTALTELAVLGGDLAVIKRELAALTAEEDQLRAELDELLAASVSERILHEIVLRFRVRDDDERMVHVARDPEEVGQAWDALSLTDQRELLRGLFTVTVHSGRTDDRVVIDYLHPAIDHAGLPSVGAR